jgi:hypothetical protein
MHNELLSIAELQKIWPGKTYDAIRIMIGRNKFTAIYWLTAKEARRAGLEWGESNRGGKGGKRPFIDISDPAIPSRVKIEYHQSLVTAPRGCIPSTGAVIPAFTAEVIAPVSALNPPEAGLQGETLCPPLSASGVSFDQLSESEIDGELYTRATDYERKRADKYMAILGTTKGLKGNELKTAIHDWNRNHADWKTSYVRVLDARRVYDEQGISGLFARYGTSSYTTVKDEWFKSFLDRYLKEGSPSVKSCWVGTLGEAYSLDQSITAKTFPGPTSFMRRVNKEIPAATICQKREGYQAWKKKHAFYLDRDYSNIVPGEVYVADHAQVDVAVISPTGKVCFPWITAISDFKSGKYVGWSLHTESPNSDHIFDAAFRAFTDFGIPSDFLIDNGKDFRCHDFSGGRKIVKAQIDEIKTASLLSGLNIAAHFAKPFNAQAKPIERTFLRNKEWFSKHMPGYRGGNTKERPEILKEEIKQGKILQWEQFAALMEEYIATVANRMPSNGKNLKGMSPDELWQKEAKAPVRVRAESLKLLCMRTTKPMIIGRNGVRDSEHQVTYWGEWMSGRKGERVYLRRDSRAFQTAWVFTADGQDRYIGEASVSELPSALARTDIEKAVVKEQLARQKRDERAARFGAGNLERRPAEDIMKDIAMGVELLNAERGYAQGDHEGPKVIQIQTTAVDGVTEERAKLAREGACDLSGVLPEKKPVKKYYIYRSDKEYDERQQRNHTKL